MRVAVLGDFDPCCFALHYRTPLAALGVEIRLAVREIYWPEGMAADWWVASPRGCDFGALRTYVYAADVVVICPAIGQPWSSTPPFLYRGLDIGQDNDGWDIEWGRIRGRRIALFHGSNLLSAHAERYGEDYRRAGWEIGATTLDYVARMGIGGDALYFPPIVEAVSKGDAAPLRADRHGLRIVHSPTDQNACGTAQFTRLCSKLTVLPAHADRPDRDSLSIYSGIPHDKMLRLKRMFHAGYDHMRGAFSINSLENTAAGLVNLVGVSPQCRGLFVSLMGHDLPWPGIATIDDLEGWLVRLIESPAETRRYQTAGRAWFDEHWTKARIASRIADLLSGRAGV